MSTVEILVGLPSSGKSTYAREVAKQKNSNTVRVNKDNLRAMLNDNIWSGTNESFVIKVRNAIILEAIASGKNVIVDDTNLHPKHIEEITELVKGIAEVHINNSFLKVPLNTCIERDLMRSEKEGRVGKKVIIDMYRKYIQPQLKKISTNPELSDAVLVDIDGTLALFGDKNPYERDFENDEPNYPVISTVKALAKEYNIIIFSGRSEKARNQTISWLSKYGIKYKQLCMRKEGDFRKDTIVKSEMYEQHIQDKYNIFAVFDDRLSVIEMWESKGLFVFNVNQGRLDF